MPSCSLRRSATALLCLLVILSSPLGDISAGPAETPTPAPAGSDQATRQQAEQTPAPAVSSEIPSSAVEASVVKIFSTVRYPALYKPWTKQAPSEITGSGVVIRGNRILTNAHVVLYASEVQIQANQGGDKVSATIEFVEPGIDLAVLKLEEKSFFESHPPLPVANTLPDIQDAVRVYGYPTGGTGLSVTKGIVSRIEFAGGGPVVVGDKMVGLAFSRLDGSQNIGYIIPLEEIDLFLQDLADGRYDGKPAMFDYLQTLENPALRSFLKLGKSVEGIVVHKPYSDAPNYPLKEWDVITRIGGAPVDNQGLIKMKGTLRVRFQYLIQKIAKEGKVPLTLVRAGKELNVDLPTVFRRARLVPDLRGTLPSYFIYGPLVFSEATAQLISDYGDGNKAADWLLDLAYMGSPLLARAGDKPAFEGQRLVFVSSPFFPHRLAKGYSNPSQQAVKTINGQPIKNLAHLVELLRDSKEEFISIEFAPYGGETEVFPRAEMIAATEEVLNDNGVRSQGSPDSLAIWNAQPTP